MAWNGSDGRPAARPSGAKCAKPILQWIVAGAIVAAVVIGVALYLSDGSDNDASAADTPKANVRDNPVPRQSKPSPAKTNEAHKVATNAPAKPPMPPPFVKRPGAMQLPDGKVLTFPPPKPGEIRKVYAYGHMYECDSEGNFRDVTPRKLFHTAFEGNFLALAVEGRTFIPAFLTGLDPEDVKKMLTKNYQPIGDETEEEMAQLKAYDEMRCAALQYMEEGGSFDDFVMDFANYEKKSRETNAMCLREVMTLCKEGKIQEAKEMAEAASKLMEQKGLRPFKLPPHVKAAFESM